MLLAGPPLVMTMIWSKTWNEPIVVTMRINVLVSLSSGNVILRKICQREAPSIVAAS
ncbi:hypothetical protein D3C74_459420 [compost metagenome]